MSKPQKTRINSPSRSVFNVPTKRNTKIEFDTTQLGLNKSIMIPDEVEIDKILHNNEKFSIIKNE
jgi:hypothetical protein